MGFTLLPDTMKLDWLTKTELECETVWCGCVRLILMRQDSQKYRNRTFEGMFNMSYTIQSIQHRAFYTYIHANLNGIVSLPMIYCSFRDQGALRTKINVLFLVLTKSFETFKILC